MANKRGGFTLLELLTVIAIFSLLSSIAMTYLNRGRISSRNSARIGQLYQIQEALELYYATHHQYPDLSDDDIPQNWSDLIDALEAEHLLANAAPANCRRIAAYSPWPKP